MKHSPSTTVVEILRHVSTCFGMPEMIASDNGPSIVSEEFLLANGVKHFLPDHPAINGLPTLVVQIFKKVTNLDLLG